MPTGPSSNAVRYPLRFPQGLFVGLDLSDIGDRHKQLIDVTVEVGDRHRREVEVEAGVGGVVLQCSGLGEGPPVERLEDGQLRWRHDLVQRSARYDATFRIVPRPCSRAGDDEEAQLLVEDHHRRAWQVVDEGAVPGGGAFQDDQELRLGHQPAGDTRDHLQPTDVIVTKGGCPLRRHRQHTHNGSTMAGQQWNHRARQHPPVSCRLARPVVACPHC
jgi:hypothetical protein